MSEKDAYRRAPEDHHFEDELRPLQGADDHASLGDLKDVKLELNADLGECRLLVREVLELRRGSVLPLNKIAGEMAELYINGVYFAKGEIVVLGDGLHVRIAEIAGVSMQDPVLGDT